MKTYRSIAVQDEGTTVSVVLRRPPLNIMNIAMIGEINAALAELRHHAEAKALVLRAEGKAFSAGVDIADHTADRIDEMMRGLHLMVELLQGFTIPTIALVDGAALGGGCELAIACDMVVASERAKFAVPEIKLAVFPPVAAAIVPKLIGRNRALELLLSGDPLSAAEAERVGLINKVFPAGEFAEEAAKFIGRFTAQSKPVLELAKRAVDAGTGRPCMDAVSLAEEIYLHDLMNVGDTIEGLKAFQEKRQPVWKNK